MADSKDQGVATHTTGYRRGSVKDIEEKQRTGAGADLDLPTYNDAERYGPEEAANISGVHDKTHRKLKARHIQLIGSVQYLVISVSISDVCSHNVALEAPSAPHYMFRSVVVC